jgi:hypothetical protein
MLNMLISTYQLGIRVKVSSISTLVMSLSIQKFLKWTYQKGLYNNLHVLEDFRYEYTITLYQLIWDMYVGIKYSYWDSFQNKKKITCYIVTKNKVGHDREQHKCNIKTISHEQF